MNILLVKTSALGDMIHLFPVLSYLKGKFPESNIDWVVERPFASLAKAHPQVRRVICVDTKKWRRKFFSTQCWNEINQICKELREVKYDIVFDLQGNAKSALFTKLARSPHKVGFALKTVPEKLNLLATTERFNPESLHNIREDYLSIVAQFFHETAPKQLRPTLLKLDVSEEMMLKELLGKLPHNQLKRVLVAPGSAWPNKVVGENVLQSALELIAKNIPCYFLFSWGSAEEAKVAAKLHAAFPNHSLVLEKQPFAVLQNIMAHMDAVLGMDSLPLHLAGTTSVKTLGIFGPSSAFKYSPSGKHNDIIQGCCPYGKKFDKRCPILRTCKTGACTHSITPEQIAHSFIHLIKN